MDLQIAGYQFPIVDKDPGDRTGWDANWLVVTGSVRTADGASWAFSDPALTTWEVADAVTWLRQVATGAVPAAAAIEDMPGGADGRDDHLERLRSTGWLTFTEPKLSFAVDGYDGQQVKLLVGLSHESAVPPSDQQTWGWCQIAVVMSRQQVQNAAAELEEELAHHPAR